MKLYTLYVPLHVTANEELFDNSPGTRSIHPFPGIYRQLFKLLILQSSNLLILLVF